MPKGQIKWNKTEQGHVTATLTLNCQRDGSVEMETPPSQGGYSDRFQSADEAARGLSTFLSEGIAQAKQ